MADEPTLPTSEKPAPSPPVPAAGPKPLVREPGSGLQQAGFVITLVAFAIAWIPFAGYLGLIGIVLAAAGRAQCSREGNAKIVASGIFGAIAIGAAAFWTYVAATASCPHVYAFDGTEYRLDADMLSGSLFEGAESDDVDRMEHLRAADGRFLLQIANERQERDFVDRVALEVVDHPAGTTALSTPSGALALLGPAEAPAAARDDRGGDRIAAVVGEDALSWLGDPAAHDPKAEARPRDALELTWPAGTGRAFLVLRARNTEAATEALYRYLATIGPGVGSLLELSECSKGYPYRQRLADELDRMGVPLAIEAQSADGWRRVAQLAPIGPAALRSIAIPLDLPEGAAVTLRLTAVPAAWEIDRVALARAGEGAMVSSVLAPARASGPAGDDLLGLLREADGRRVAIERGERVQLSFEAPAPREGQARSVFLRLRGYYDVQIGGRGWLDPIALARHHLDDGAAPRFFLQSLEGAR